MFAVDQHFAGRDEKPRTEEFTMSPVTVSPTLRNTADGIASMLPRLVSQVEQCIDGLTAAEADLQHIRERYPSSSDRGHWSRAEYYVMRYSQDLDTAVRMLRTAVMAWCHLTGTELSPGEPIPCLDGTEYDGASLSDLEV